MRALGLDLSLTATGFANDQGVGVLKPKKMNGPRRLIWLRDEVMAEVAALGPDSAVFLEGYSFGAQRGMAHHLSGELGGVIRVALWEQEVQFIEVPPAVVKKYATGSGNANKDWVLAEAVRRAPPQYVIRGNDEADAFWLYALGMDLMGVPLVTVPAVNRSALTKMTWPPVAA